MLQCSSAEAPKQQGLQPSAKALAGPSPAGDKDQQEGETQKPKPTVTAAARPKPSVKAPKATSKAAPSRSSSSKAKPGLETEGEDELDEAEPVIPKKKQKVLRPAEPKVPPPQRQQHDQHIDLLHTDDTDDENDQQCDRVASIAENLPRSWHGIIAFHALDDHSLQQLSLLHELSFEAASEIIWKLTKEREYPITNPSAFVSRCVSSARKEIHSRW